MLWPNCSLGLVMRPWASSGCAGSASAVANATGSAAVPRARSLRFSIEKPPDGGRARGVSARGLKALFGGELPAGTSWKPGKSLGATQPVETRPGIAYRAQALICPLPALQECLVRLRRRRDGPKLLLEPGYAVGGECQCL